MIEIAPLIKIASFHGTYFLIWKAPMHSEWEVGGTSWSSFLVLHIFKNFICTEFDSSATNSKNLSITSPILWWMEWIKGFCMLLCIVATCTLRAFWMCFRTLIIKLIHWLANFLDSVPQILNFYTPHEKMNWCLTNIN